MGDTFLRHFYSVFNFGANTVGLGVNIHSAKVAKIYNASSEYAYNASALI